MPRFIHNKSHWILNLYILNKILQLWWMLQIKRPSGSWLFKLIPSLSLKAASQSLNCWIRPIYWPPCTSLKSQSRKTAELICHDGSAWHANGIWKIETSCLFQWGELFMLSSCHWERRLEGCGSFHKSSALLTFASIIRLVSSKKAWWLETWSSFNVALSLDTMLIKIISKYWIKAMWWTF